MSHHRYLSSGRLRLALLISTAYLLVQVGIVHAGTLSFGGGPTSWTVTMNYCTNGFSVTYNGGAAGAGITSTVLVTASTIPLATGLPALAGSVVGSSPGVPTASGTAIFPFTNSQPVGTNLTVTISRQDNGVDIGGSPQSD